MEGSGRELANSRITGLQSVIKKGGGRIHYMVHNPNVIGKELGRANLVNFHNEEHYLMNAASNLSTGEFRFQFVLNSNINLMYLPGHGGPNTAA